MLSAGGRVFGGGRGAGWGQWLNRTRSEESNEVIFRAHRGPASSSLTDEPLKPKVSNDIRLRSPSQIL